MKKQIKTKMLSLALIAGVAATAGALALNHSAKQAAAESSGVFQMENTVRLRLNGDGLAFSVKMDKAKYNEITNDKNKSLYFIVMPSMYLGNVKMADGYDYAKAIARNGNGDYNYKDSHCLYVNASEAIYKSGEDYYALGGVSDVLEANRKLDYVAVACVETKSESGFTYEYAALPEGKEQMPTVSQYTTLSKSVLYSTTDYSAQIAQYYNWFGKGEYALTIATTEDYNALVGKINGGADLADMELRINSGVDRTQVTLNEGMALPAKQVTYSTVKFYDDDGTTLLSSADVNDGKNVTPPTTPEKAATEEYTYTFEKWVTEKDGDVAASFDNITENTSVYAKYTAVKKRLFGVAGYFCTVENSIRVFDTDLTIAQSGLQQGNTITGFVTASNGTDANEYGLQPYYKTATTFTVYNHGGTFAIGFDAGNLPGSGIVTFMKGTIFNINGVEYALDQTYVFYSTDKNTKVDNFSEYTLSKFVAGNSFSSSIPKDERGGGNYYTQVQLTSGGVTSTEWIYLQFHFDGKTMITIKRDETETCGWKTGDVVYIKKGTVASFWSGVAISAEDYTLTKTADGWVLATGAPTI